MSVNEKKLAAVLREIHPQWREDFVRLIEGEAPSQEFEDYFERSAKCRRQFDDALRVLDEELVPVLQEALTTLHKTGE